MQCLEDGVTFVNLLSRQLNSSTSSPPTLTASQIHNIMEQTQNMRKSRNQKLVEESFLAQKMQAWKTPLFKFFATQVLPRIGFDFVLALFLDGARAAPTLEGLPLPRRSAAVGFDDQHPEPKSLVRSMAKSLAYLVLVSAAAYTVIGPRLGLEFETVADSDQESNLHRINIGGLLAVLLVEGYRRSNKLTVVQWPLPWALLGDYVGFGSIIPFFCLANLFVYSSRGRMQVAITHRVMVLSAANVLFPVLGLSYLLPAAYTLYFQSGGTLVVELRSWISCLSQPQPASIAVLVTFLASLLPMGQDSFFGDKYLRYLNRGFGILFVVLALFHIRYSGGPMQMNPLSSMMPAYASMLAWLIATVLEVHHYCHRSTRGSTLVPMTLVPLGFLLVGPGATTIAVWWWRELLMSNEWGLARAAKV
jgi:hypothetical protein